MDPASRFLGATALASAMFTVRTLARDDEAQATGHGRRGSEVMLPFFPTRPLYMVR